MHEAFAQRVEESLGAEEKKSGAWAVAVSGGGDSLALMHLLAAFARDYGLPPPVVLTVDHGLRPSSGKEAQQVVGWAKEAGLKAHRLVWQGPVPRSGLEAAAREARYRLMGAFLLKHRMGTLFVGHTEDDQAETFLLRLARGSGLDGLSAMRPRAPWPVAGFDRLCLARPLLTFSRQVLRDYLQGLGQSWLEDPMNEDPAFDRVKIRKVQAALEEAGLSAPRIAAAAAHLARARESLEMLTDTVLARVARPLPQGLLLDAEALAAAPRELALRALASILMTVSGRDYRPRFDSLERLLDGMAEGKLGRGATLHGCHIHSAEKDFAPFSLWVQPERPRKTGSSGIRGP